MTTNHSFTVEIEDCDGYDATLEVLAKDEREARLIAVGMYRAQSARAESAAIIRIEVEQCDD